MSNKMGFWKFIAIGNLGIVFGIAIFHFTWAAPQIDRKEKMSAVVNAAHAVQLATIQHYALMPGANASNIDLEREFIDKGALSSLVRLSKETGITTDTRFSEERFGNALALSNFVLTTNGDPQILRITDLERVTEQRRHNLIDSVAVWPWS